MIETLQGLVLFEWTSAPVLIVSAVYAVLESASIYDVRLIQAQSGRMSSGVALRAGSRSLPEWVGFLAIAGWVSLLVLAVLNWMFAGVFYGLVFVLKVFPFLERMGEALMRPFLQSHERGVPAFVSWWYAKEADEMNLVDALESYVLEFGLVEAQEPTEPENVRRARAILTVLEAEELPFDTDST
ncbi:MAG: hypothetical protein LC667_07605, partial [Thioalkalivibrio sp.]|nr:hypothetical protein [Thioalkalivibrio sp.]